MLLKCQALPNTSTELSKAVWIATFREHGLPRVIRTDNGVPFASIGIGGLSRLSTWWICLGIIPERIAPGKPQQNGSHENMHRALKQEIVSTPQANLKSQQKAFNDFVYNTTTSGLAALGQQVPASLYSSSARQYPLILPELEYPSDMMVRHVRTNGEIRWRGEMLFISEVLSGEYVGFEQIDDRCWALHYGPVPLAILDDSKRSWLPAKKAAPIIRQLRKEKLQLPNKC